MCKKRTAMETVKRKSGNRFREKITINNRTITSKWFYRKTDARDWKANKLVERDRIGVSGIFLNDSITVEELFTKYIESRQDRAKRTLEAYNSAYKLHIRPVIGNLSLKVLRLHHGEIIRTNLWNSGVSPCRGNNVLIQLKVLFNFAVKQEHLLGNPFKNLDSFRQDKREIIFWNNYEVSKFLDSTKNDRNHSIYSVALNTGMRKSELCGLMWDCIDFNEKIITVKRTRDRGGLKETTKGREVRKIPMNETVYKLLKSLYETRNHPSYVFSHNGVPTSYEHLGDRVFKRALLKAGVRQIRFHDLRTTFASNWVINDGNIYVLSRILGHKSVTITQNHYAELNNASLRNEAERVSFSTTVTGNVSNILSVEIFNQHRNSTEIFEQKTGGE